MRNSVAAVAVVTVLSLSTEADAQISLPTSTFSVSGVGDDGVKYTGTATLTLIGGSMYNAKWVIGSSTLGGICFRDNAMLSCAWSTTTKGLMVFAYLVKPTTLDGVWFRSGDVKLGHEVLTGPSGVKGKYKITTGKNPDGSTYSGVAAIIPRNGVYELQWTIGSSQQKGLGIRLTGGSDDVIAVASTTAGDYGALQYKIAADGKSMTGVWVQSIKGVVSKGTETMTKL